MNIQRLKERYAAPEIPPCRVCGGELTIQRAGGGPTVWGCTGMIDDPAGERNWVYAEGRECADDHYERSRWSDYRQGGDADVIELIDALEAAERERDGAMSTALAVADAWVRRAKVAEAELARRDAAKGECAGKPVISDDMAYAFHSALSDSSIGADDVDEIKKGLRAAFANITAAQPAVLPPEKPVHTDLSRTDIMKNIAYNQALDDVKALGAYPAVVSDDALREVIRTWQKADFPSPEVFNQMREVIGAQPQKPVVLPEIIRHELIDVLTWIERLPVPTKSAAAKAIRLRKAINDIDAANVKWEVKE